MELTDQRDPRIHPEKPSTPADEQESPDVWGFLDSGFTIGETGHVEMAGGRYPLSGQELPELLPWISKVIDVELDAHDKNPSHYPPPIPEPRRNEAFLEAIGRLLGEEAISDDAALRLRHGHGHTQEEMFAIKHGEIDRIPDLVVFPGSHEDVAAIVELAVRHDVSLIPYGGGTSVTCALRCPEGESRVIVSVDMSRMNRILWLDPVNQMACIEAGAVGRRIVEQLHEYGYTLGHEPDSIEFSTLGGWVATRASGMKKNKYGNIEDLVLDARAVTASGELGRSFTVPRESVGTDPGDWLLGSEGNLGIITSAVVKIFELPEVQRYGSVIFRTFEDGVAFMYDLTRSGRVPASVRLVDNMQFQFSMALKPRKTGVPALKSRLEKLYVTGLRGFDPDRMVACTVVFEGRRQDVEQEEANLYRIARDHGGLKAGGANGEAGYQLTFGIAYIRDFVMNHYLLAESFETSVSWDQALALCTRVKKRVRDEHERRKLPGRPFISCRVTQVYETGVCVYFYLAYYYKGVPNPSAAFAEVEHAAREEILAAGGSLSHHHGIGKLRQGFLPDVLSGGALEWNQRIKGVLDPTNVFGAGNHGMRVDPDR